MGTERADSGVLLFVQNITPDLLTNLPAPCPGVEQKSGMTTNSLIY